MDEHVAVRAARAAAGRALADEPPSGAAQPAVATGGGNMSAAKATPG